jgi:hypothetical protein
MRVECGKSSSVIVAGLVLVVVISSGRAQASPVTISGGFTGFIGQSGGANGFPSTNTSPGCDGSFQGIVAGSVVQAPACAERRVPNPDPTKPDAIFPGVSGPASSTFSSTSSLEFYEKQFGADLPHNNVTFTPAPEQDVEIGGLFIMGELSFTNGTWFGTGAVNRFHLDLKTVSLDSALNNHTLSEDLVLEIRVGNTQNDNSDCVSFATFTLNRLCAYERDATNPFTAKAKLYGKIGSLIPVEFRDVEGGFLLAADPVAAPEPLSVILVGTGLVAMLRRRLRQ